MANKHKERKQNKTLFLLTLLLIISIVLSITYLKNESNKKENIKIASRVTSILKPSPNATKDSTVQINVLSISYTPILNGRLDTTNYIKDTYGEYNFTLGEIRKRITNIQQGLITTLESGSKYHGYKNPDATPYLVYKIIDEIELQKEIPLTDQLYNSLPLPDYEKMMSDLDICNYVDNNNIKEVWLWSYGGTGKAGWESNFSSPNYPDISNSNKDENDLPVCSKSYTVYDYNYGRGISEATEDHIHQYEAIFNYIDRDFFWNKYVGYFPGGNWSTSSQENQNRRCGWAHYPPNGEEDYDWANSNSQLSDCENWNPDSYTNPSKINCSKWNCESTGYFIWWMQNIPGQDNQVAYKDKQLRNWWEFIADFDKAMEVNLSFFK